MTWYPSVDDVSDANITVLHLSGDRHPHRLLGLRAGIQRIIDRVKKEESKGLTYQAALLMRELVNYHPFAGGNHRTAYIMAKVFLRRNGKRLKVTKLETAYSFIKDLGNRNIEEIQQWIEDGTSKES